MKNLSQVSNTKDVATKEYVDTQLGNGGETLPVGSEIDFDGTAQDIPVGWEEVEDTREIYTQTERRIGTWVDGKPIYRKVVEITSLPNQTAHGYAHNIENLNIVTNTHGIERYTYNNYLVQNPLININPGAGQGYNSCGYDITPTDIEIFSQNADRSSHSATIVIEYTKTTD